MSIVSYDLAGGEEPFLSFTWDRREGPPLWRDGTSAPKMKVINTTRDETSHPMALRFGTWLVREIYETKSERTRDFNSIKEALSHLPPDSADAPVLRNMRDETATLQSHEKLFKDRLGQYKIIGIHGCGDLTMNSWNVAFADGVLTESGATIVALPEEPFHERRYSCLVKWKPTGGGRARLSIEEVIFNKLSDIGRGKTNNLVAIQAGDTWLPRGDRIEFAVSNQQVIRNGSVVSAVENCHQFGDLRHLLQLPNLNPDAPLTSTEKQPYQKRSLFGRPQTSDIWLGEAFLIRRNNLVRAALSGPITIEIPHDLGDRHLHAAMDYARYQKVANAMLPLGIGQWRETDLKEGRQGARTIEIYFRRNKYAWNMLGLTKDRSRLLSLACDANPGRTGYVLEDAARLFLENGAWDALLIDEGADVFQLVDLGGDDLEPLLRLKRTRLRCAFIVGKPGGATVAETPK